MNIYDEMRTRRLTRSDDGVFLGVCAGIAEYWDFKPWGVRLLFIALQITIVPIMIFIYLALALILKKSTRWTYDDPCSRW